MSSSVTHPGAPTGRPGRFVGLAAAGLAVVVAVGIGFTLSQDQPDPVTSVQPAHPSVSLDDRPRIGVADGKATSPGANPEQYKADRGITGVNPTETFNIEQYRIEMEREAGEWHALFERQQEYVQFLQERAQKSNS